MTTAAEDRVRAYLDFLLTYPGGFPVVRKVYGYLLRSASVRTLLGDASVDPAFDAAATAVEEFLAAYARTGEDVIDSRPTADHPEFVLTVADLAEVVAAARRRQARALLADADERFADKLEHVVTVVAVGLAADRQEKQLAIALDTIRAAQKLTGDYVNSGGQAHEVIRANRILRGLPAYAG